MDNVTVNDQVRFFIGTLNDYLARGVTPDEALSATVADYAFVYHADDGRDPFARAGELTLRDLRTEMGSGMVGLSETVA
jgi:hypothetical protein